MDSGGSEWQGWLLITVGIILVSISVLGALNQLINFRKIPLYVTVSVYIGWFCCFGILLLLPLDVIMVSPTNRELIYSIHQRASTHLAAKRTVNKALAPVLGSSWRIMNSSFSGVLSTGQLTFYVGLHIPFCRHTFTPAIFVGSTRSHCHS